MTSVFPTFSTVYGELRPCIEKRFRLSHSSFYAISDSVDNPYHRKSPLPYAERRYSRALFIQSSKFKRTLTDDWQAKEETITK